MNKYIAELLNTNSRVIIPELGAFIVKQKNPVVVVFNEFLRYNDGLLVDYIAVKEQIEKDAAKEKVSAFVKEANEKLSKVGEFVIAGLGKLIKETSGKISFSEEKDINKPKDIAKEKEIKKEEHVKEESVVVEFTVDNENNKQTKSEPAPKSAEPVNKPTNAEADKTGDKAKIEQTVVTHEKEKPAGKPLVEKPVVEKSKQPTVAVKNIQEEKKPVEETVDEKTVKKKNNLQYILWILLILIVNGAILGWLLFNDKVKEWMTKDDIKKEVPASTAESIQKDNNQSDEMNAEETDQISEADISEQLQSIEEESGPETKIPVSSYNEKKYYIVAGCFREENNADALVRELRNRGFNAEKFGKIGNLHAVSFASFIDKASATQELRKIRRNEQPEAWIIYY